MGYFDNYLDLYVSNGDTSDETDINVFASDVWNAFVAVEGDIGALELNQNQAIKWARDPVGSSISETIGGDTIVDYSARAYAAEAASYANQTVDVQVVGADGVNTGDFSALHYSEKASDSATSAAASSTSANQWAEANIGTGAPGVSSASSKQWAEGAEDTQVVAGSYSSYHWAQKAEDSATEAAASASSALGANTVSSGSGITINTTGTGPYDYQVTSPLAASAVQPARTINAGGGLTGGGDLSANITISHADTSSAANVSYTGAAVVSTISFDDYGHVTGHTSRNLTPANIGALALTGGTITGNLTVNGTLLFPDAGLDNKVFLAESGVANIITKNIGISGRYTFGTEAAPCRYVGLSVVLRSDGRDITFYGGDPYPNIRPENHNTVSLGISTKRWSEIWSQNALNTTSDERLKVIEDIGDTAWLYNLAPIAYRWKEDQELLRYGFSAQDTYSKVPSQDVALVSIGDESVDWGMAPTELIAPMLKLIQDQKKQIDELEARIETLEAK